MAEASAESPKRVLLTGATGFVGSFLCESLRERPGTELHLALRTAAPTSLPHTIVGDFTGDTDWTSALEGVETVIHCAGRAHMPREKRNNTAAPYREINTRATLALARQAAAMGVKRFIFLSSIGVNGVASRSPFTPDDTPAPQDPYTRSKLEAENGLWALQRETGIEVVIVRPPLIYGPNAPGNFGLLMRFLHKGLPLPLKGINNKRAFVAIWNLTDLLVTCLDHPMAANQTFLVRDGEEVSTSQFLARIAAASGKRTRLFWMPQWLIRLGAILLGRQSMYHSLFSSLQIDDSKTRNTLNWHPPLTLDEGLRRTIQTTRKEPQC